MWDSTKQAMSVTPSGGQSPRIPYNGTALTGTSETTYYWRIKFLNTYNLASNWSTTATFVDLIGDTSLKLGGLNMGGVKVR